MTTHRTCALCAASLHRLDVKARTCSPSHRTILYDLRKRSRETGEPLSALVEAWRERSQPDLVSKLRELAGHVEAARPFERAGQVLLLADEAAGYLDTLDHLLDARWVLERASLTEVEPDLDDLETFRPLLSKLADLKDALPDIKRWNRAVQGLDVVRESVLDEAEEKVDTGLYEIPTPGRRSQ